MIVKMLMEDTCQTPGFRSEHGLSLYIESNGVRILFDTGQSSAFIQNADTLGIDLSKVDFAVLSHAHYDHSGGIAAFLACNDHAPVYVSPFAFDDLRSGPDRYIGPDKSLSGHPRLVSVAARTRLADGIYVYPAFAQTPVQPVRAYGLQTQRNGELIPDDFRHEQYLEIVEDGRKLLLSGCSHMGAINILHWFHPDVLIGGLHLFKLDPHSADQAALDTVAHALAATNTVFYTCHCTGLPQYEHLKQSIGDRISHLTSGQEITISS